MSTSDPNLEGFLFDEGDAFLKHQNEFRPLVSIDRGSNAILIHNASRFTDGERIVLYLVGRYLRHRMQLGDSEASNDDIANDLHIDPSIVRARLKDLRNQGLVTQVSRGVHRITFLDIDQFLTEIKNKVKEGKTDGR